MIIAKFWGTILLVAVSLTTRISARGNLRDELVRRQRETGLTLMGFAWGVVDVSFNSRSSSKEPFRLLEQIQNGVLSPDGQEIAIKVNPEPNLAIVRRDGTALRQFAQIRYPESLCWSKDQTKLVVAADDLKSQTRPPQRKLLILDLASNTTQVIGNGRAYTTPQCWSPDGRRIVYAIGETIGVYDLVQKKWNELAHGQSPSWSPDGKWIGFLDRDTYYRIRPDGGDRQALFKKKNVRGGLVWSPDSTMVAYVNLSFHFQLVPDCTMAQLHVRRLADNADEQVDHFCGLASYEWIWLENERRQKPEAKHE